LKDTLQTGQTVQIETGDCFNGKSGTIDEVLPNDAPASYGSIVFVQVPGCVNSIPFCEDEVKPVQE
jgi:hypothetical protein